MRDPLDQLEGELTQSYLARVTVADKWTSCITFAVFCVCVTAIVLGLVDILHQG